MINLYEINDYNIAMIDCGDDLDTDLLENINWSFAEPGDKIFDANENYIGTVAEVGEKSVTITA